MLLSTAQSTTQLAFEECDREVEGADPCSCGDRTSDTSRIGHVSPHSDSPRALLLHS